MICVDLESFRSRTTKYLFQFPSKAIFHLFVLTLNIVVVHRIFHTFLMGFLSNTYTHTLYYLHFYTIKYFRSGVQKIYLY